MDALKTKIISIFFLIVATGALFGFSSSALAGPTSYERCEPNADCILGEFLFDGDYNPVITNVCVIDVRDPNGDIVIDSQATTFGDVDGWHSFTFNAAGPEGFYRAIMCCTVAPDTACMDKSFILGTSFETLGDISAETGLLRESTFDFTGYADLGSTDTTLVDAELTQTDNYWNGYTLVVLSGVNAGEEREVTDFDSATDTLTFSPALAATISQGDKYVLRRDEKLISKIWSATTRTLSSATNVAGDIWNSPSRTLTAIGSLAGDIWNNAFAPTRRLTDEQLTSGESLATENYIDSEAVVKIDNLQADVTYLRSKIDLLDTIDSQVGDLMTKFGSYDVADIMTELEKANDQLDEVATDVSGLDELTDTANENLDQTKEVQNKLIQLKNLVEINRSLIEKKPVVKAYYEWGSVILKLVVANPAETKQIISFRVALPREVKPEFIIQKSDGVNIEYDTEKDSWFASVNLEVEAGRSIIKQVEVKDIWLINPEEIASLRARGEELAKPLEKTAYFAQGVTLTNDLNSRLDKISRTQKEEYVTPEEHIGKYRENLEELKAAEQDMENLQRLVTETSSRNLFQGSLLGVSTATTWAIILVVVVGIGLLMAMFFIFWGRENRKNQSLLAGQKENTLESQSTAKSDNKEIKVAIIVLAIAVILLIGVAIFWLVKNSDNAPVRSIQNDLTVEKSSPVVVEENANPAETAGKESISELVQSEDKPNKEIVIKPTGIGWLNVRQEPSAKSALVGKINEGTALVYEEIRDDWYKITLANGISGWISGEYVETQQN